MSTPPPYTETADIETSSEGYAARFSGPSGAWMLGVQEQITQRMLAGLEAPHILDVGGGHGQLARPLVEAGCRVTVLGSDLSCGQRLEDLISSGRLNFITGNVIDLPFEAARFDAVLCFRLVTHCKQWERLLAELARVARDRVIIDYPTTRSLNAISPLLFGAKKKLEGNTRHWRLFRHGELDRELLRAGWVLDERVGQFFWPMVLHRQLQRPAISKCLEAPPRWLGLCRLLGSPVIASYKPMP